MRKYSVLLLGLFAMGLSANERFVDKTFNVEPGSRFSIDSHKGHIQIRTGNAQTVEIHAKIYLGDDYQEELSEDEQKRILEHLEIRINHQKRNVTVDVNFDQDAVRESSGFFFKRGVSMPYVDFDILVPDDSSLDVETHKSTVDIDAPSGRVRLESHKGHGTLRSVRNRLELITHKGDFEVQILQMDDIEVETHKGNVDISIAGPHNFLIRGSSHKGDFSFRGLDIPIQSKKRESYIDYEVGTGEHNIDLETHKGRISIDFAE